jgi:predicted RNase H-like HicB family nuclease
MKYYVGILDGSDDVWGVRVPDCPGCHGGGATPEAAISDAISALREWAAEMRADGIDLPTARTTTEILANPESHPDVAAGESAVLIPPDSSPPRSDFRRDRGNRSTSWRRARRSSPSGRR